MPWSVKKQNKKFCVVKEGEDSPIKGGCHASKSEAAAHVRALYASEAEAAVSELYTEEVDMEELDLSEDVDEFGCDECENDTFQYSDTMKEYAWEGPIVFENVTTGDNRVFKADSINWQEDTLPWAFRWQKHSGQGHAGSVPVGRVDRIERKDDGSIYGYGVVIPELSAEAQEYLNLLKTGVGGGVSVDGDSAQFEIQEQESGQPRVEFSSMRLRALSAVDIPAFNGARIRLVESAPTEAPVEVFTDEDELVVESETEELAEGKKPFPFKKDEEEEDQDKAEDKKVKSEDDDETDSDDSEEEEDEEVEDKKAKSEDDEDEDDEDDKDKKKDFPFQLTGRGDEASYMREELAKKKAKRKKVSYGWNISDALTAAAIPTLPSTDSFIDPVFDGPTPLTVTPEGRVFGHLALFNTCHIGFPGTCVKPPKGSKYQYFHTGQIETAEGDLVDVGKLTFKTGHAEMAANPRTASEHYDNTGAVAADVRAGEDKWGIWVAGALRPHLTDEDIREFRAAPLSGDWRRIAGKLELVGALSVNVPGFPVPRVKALVASGETETLFTFLEDTDEELNSRYDKKIELAMKVEKFLGEKLDPNAPDGPIDEDPPIPTKSEIKSAAEKITKSELFKHLKIMREFLNDPDNDIPKTRRKTMEELYALFIKTDEKGKRTEASGYDLDIIESSGLDIEEWEKQLEFSGLSVEEFYNRCHDENGRFCEGDDGPGRIRDKAPTSKHFLPGEPHGKDHPGHKTGSPGGSPSGGSPSGRPGGPPSSPPSSGPPGGGSTAYENYRVTKKRAIGWISTAMVAYAALASPASGVLTSVLTPLSPLLANPAVLSLVAATGVAYATKNYLKSRQHRINYNHQIDRKLKIQKVEEQNRRNLERARV